MAGGGWIRVAVGRWEEVRGGSNGCSSSPPSLTSPRAGRRPTLDPGEEMAVLGSGPSLGGKAKGLRGRGEVGCTKQF